MLKPYLRRTGKVTPLGTTPRETVWSVRVNRKVVGYVTAAHTYGVPEDFRGFTAVGRPVTPRTPDRTATRNLVCARRDWT